VTRALAAALVAFAVAGCPVPRRPTAPPPAATAAAWDVTELPFRHESGAETALDILQTSAGGCGLLDYDGDGLLDLYLVQGRHTPGSGNRLYRNRGGGEFDDVTDRAGVRGRGYGLAAAVGDYDGDGRPDLYVCNHGTSELFRNRGDGTFEEVAARLGAAVRGCAIAAVFADFDGDGRPDLYVARYVKLLPDSPRLCRMNGVPTACGPQLYDPHPGVLLRNEGGRFRDVTRAAGVVNPGRAMAVTAADADGDGDLDLLVANDTTANALFLNDGKGRFRDAALESGVAYGYMGQAEGNMGADWGDYDGDEDLDLFIGVMQDRVNPLYRNEGGGSFRMVSHEAGLATPTSPVVTYGVGFLDADNDGDLDLFQANGHVQSNIEQVDPAQRYHQPRQLLENLGDGTFRDAAAALGPAFAGPAAGRGAAFGDLDNDGDVDILVTNLDGPAVILWNRAERLGRHWLRVRLVGRAPNTQPEGAEARLTVGGKVLLRHLRTAVGYASASDPRLHFGLGDAATAGPLEVRWPSGSRQTVQVPAVDCEILVREPS